MKSTCLNCTFYKIEDIFNGFCRVLVKETGDKNAGKPMVTADHTCQKWKDAGQQYFIRIGWLKNLKKQKALQEQ